MSLSILVQCITRYWHTCSCIVLLSNICSHSNLNTCVDSISDFKWSIGLGFLHLFWFQKFEQICAGNAYFKRKLDTTLTIDGEFYLKATVTMILLNLFHSLLITILYNLVAYLVNVIIQKLLNLTEWNLVCACDIKIRNGVKNQLVIIGDLYVIYATLQALNQLVIIGDLYVIYATLQALNQLVIIEDLYVIYAR